MRPVPKALRRRVPDRIRDDPFLRPAALALGLILPRPMHSAAEAEVLARLAARARRVVEIGVYEGSSAVMFCGALSAGAELHLIDPFVVERSWSLRPDWRASPLAARLTVRRAARRAGVEASWYIARSQDVGRAWNGPNVDLVFVDGDHSFEACREDWEVWHAHVGPGGAVAFHDARLGHPAGERSSHGPSAVVEELFRSSRQPGWRIVEEVERLVVVRRDPDGGTEAE